VLAHTSGDLGMKIITTAALKKLGFRTALIFSAAAFACLIGSLAFVDAKTPLAVLLMILLPAGLVRSLQMTALSSLQFADVPHEKMTGASTYASLNLNITRAVGIAFAALVLSTAIASHAGNADAPTVFDFHVAFVAAALLSVAAMLRYLTLPLDAGRHVSRGR
jgi:hypothetical protein